ncbi:hypothetical protein ACOMHN_045031 [Nucella lapillus]
MGRRVLSSPGFCPRKIVPRTEFDASTYSLGPEEEIRRKLEYMDFLCHALSDYFKAKNAPYPVIGKDPDLCYIWTSPGPEIRTTPSLDEIFGVNDENEEAASKVSSSSSSGKNAKEREGKEKDKNKDDRKAVKIEYD